MQLFRTNGSPDTDRINDVPSHKKYWNWGGQYIGYRAQQGLFLANGRQLGYFAEGDEVYACSGEYLGEVRGANRLLTNLTKKKWARGMADPLEHKRSTVSSDTTVKAIPCGYEDFPR